jgi:hypothetical protein
MKVQLKNLKSTDVYFIFNTLSRIIYKLNNDTKSLSRYELYYDISEFLETNYTLANNCAQYYLFQDKHYSIVLHLYDAEGDPTESEIIVKEDNVLFENQDSVDFIFIPRQMLLSSSNIDAVYTGIFVTLHLAFKLVSNTNNSNIIEDENYTLLSSLLAALLVSDDIFYLETNIFGIYKDITKETIDKLLDSNIIVKEPYIHMGSEFNIGGNSVSMVEPSIAIKFYNIIS